MSDKKKSDFVKDVPTSGDHLEIAKAIGEGIAAKLNTQRPVDYDSAAAVSVELDKRANRVKAKQEAFAKKITKEKDKYVNIQIPLVYKQFVPSMTVSINGCTIKLVAGKTYKVHQLYADEINKRLRHIDKKVERMRQGDKGADIQLIHGF